MKRLIIMRHAKSAWDTNAPTDHSRPLNRRGRRDAPRMGEALAERGWVPDLVLSSDSERTRQTWDGCAQAFDDEIEVRFTPDLYHAGPSEVIDACEALGDHETVMVLGHNPGWEACVQYFSGEPERMTTANCALLEAEGDWSELMRPGAWRLVRVLRPKEL